MTFDGSGVIYSNILTTLFSTTLQIEKKIVLHYNVLQQYIFGYKYAKKHVNF